MITQHKRKDLKKLIENEDYNYQYSSLIANNLKAIYTLFGWTHMLKDYHKADYLIDELTLYVYQSLSKENAKEARVSSAGLTIEGWFDGEDYLNLDYYFNLE